MTWTWLEGQRGLHSEKLRGSSQKSRAWGNLEGGAGREGLASVKGARSSVGETLKIPTNLPHEKESALDTLHLQNQHHTITGPTLHAVSILFYAGLITRGVRSGEPISLIVQTGRHSH